MIPTEWTLHHKVVQIIFALTDRPHIDLFASAENARLPTFCTRYPHPQAWATDALQIDWNNLFAYAFPPISLLPKVITKIEQERCQVLLIAPFWPRQAWFPRLVRLLIQTPLILPHRPDIISQPRSGIVHPKPQDLHLTCWPLCNDTSRQQAFQKTLPLWPHEDDGLRHVKSTAAGYDILTHGAGSDLWIQPQHL